jgi:N-acetylglucosamine-6-phosphate deacetylase
LTPPPAAGSTSTCGIAAARVVGTDGSAAPGTVWFDSRTGLVAAGAGGGARSARLLDLGDRIVAAGYVDVHVHGGAGAQVNGGSPGEVEEALTTMAAFHARHGTTGLLATAVSDTPERLAATVAGVARVVRQGAASGARILGSHLEGPFLAPGRAGAQDPSHIRPPDRLELNRLLEAGEGTVRLVTLAPELAGADSLIADCLAAGAAVALGHTDAGYDEARRAFDAGASHVAHLCNAMAPVHHRRPGLVGAALLDRSATVEVVCDLQHVHPAVVTLVARAAPGRMVLVTDAIAAAGTVGGRHLLGSVPVVVVGTRATLAHDPETLAGSVLTMEEAVRNASGRALLPLADAVAAASSVPAGVLGRAAPPGLGTLSPGAPADLVVLQPTLAVAATVVGGVAVHDPGGLLG